MDYKKAVQIIKDGGYATSHTYVQNLCNIIERWNLTQYNASAQNQGGNISGWYRVRKSWQNAASQKGAFHDLAYAKQCADANPGYTVYDPAGRTGNKLRQDRLLHRKGRVHHRGRICGCWFCERLGQAEIRCWLDCT